MEKPINIAYVEDHLTTRNILKGFLVQYGFTVQIEAQHGKDLLDQLEEAETIPDVCLLDLNMPVMNGFETAIQLKAKYPAIKILAYSTDDYTDRVEAILKCGADGFVSKDVEPTEIRAGLLAVHQSQPFIRQHESSIQNSKKGKAEYPTPIHTATA